MSKFIDLDDLLDTNQKVYVRNNALASSLLMIIQMKDRSGRSRALKVPPTRYPICISTEFSKDMIRECTDLRQALVKGVLVLVDPVDAEKELKTPEAREELNSLAVSVYSDAAPQNAVRDSMQRLKEKSSGVVETAEVLKKSALSGEKVTPRVQALIASLTGKEKNSKDILLQLKRLKSTMSEADLTYIISNCDKETTVREFAESALADLSGS